MNLIKTSFFSAIITLIRISSGFIANKIVAIFAGAVGVAIVGAFANFISIALTLANGAINTGVVKYTAEYEDNEIELKALLSTAFKITLFCSIFTGTILIIFAPYLSNWIFAQKIYVMPIRILGFSVFFYALNTLLISILNGKKQIKTYTIVNALGSIIGLIFTIILVFFYKIQGALYAMVLSQSIVFFITAGLLIKSTWFSWSYFNDNFDKVKAIRLSHYSLMAIISALTVPISQILLRNILINKFGINQAGYWQGMMRISDAYLMVITTSLSTYFLPKLSSIKTDSELRSEILNGYKLIIPLVIISCIGVYFFRYILIRILFTSDFVLMGQLFYWQLVGDFFKITAWILAYVILAKSMTKIYVLSEIVFSFGYVGMGYLFTELYQLEGAVIAFAVNYFLYCLFMLFIFRRLLFGSIVFKS